ncbi:MAG: hypothetical protein JO119_10025 [Acidobacteria bacterium]|nr:hypothetical protein [Acidobacteriota bacterium]
MKLIRQIRIASAIAVVLLCARLTRAQDASASWLLHPPKLAARQTLDLDLASANRTPTQSPSSSQTPGTENSAAGTYPSNVPVPNRLATRAELRSDEHRFWDATNDWLFAGVGASRTLDYFSTLNMRHRGRDEILLTNDVVDNHAAFAVIEVAGTGASIGVSYLFHHYGHHKLERATSIVHIGLATSGAVRNYCLKTAHPATAAPASAMFTIARGLAPIAGPH